MATTCTATPGGSSATTVTEPTVSKLHHSQYEGVTPYYEVLITNSSDNSRPRAIAWQFALPD